jgi:hypothetical protein
MNSTSLSVSRSIVVDAPQDRCFATFIDMTSWWPLARDRVSLLRRAGSRAPAGVERAAR